jgi:hypothetical protein
MIVRTLITVLLLSLIVSASPRGVTVRCVGILQYKPDGTKQSAVFYSDGALDSAYISEKKTYYSDGYVLMEKPDHDRMFSLAAKIYESAKSLEMKAFNYDELLECAQERGKVILFIETGGGKAKQFVRDYDKEFGSTELKQLDSFLQELLEK